MTFPGDRPAAELLAEWNDPWYRAKANELGRTQFGHILERLARAELALAELAKLPDAWEEQYSMTPTMWPLRCAAEEVRDALRAFQGGQT